MAITIVATAGASNANSYATEADWIAYCATLLNPPANTSVAGSTCTETEKKAMVEAGKVFNLLPWSAHRTNNTQSMAWPRQYVENPDAPGVFSLVNYADLFYANDVVPSRVKNGQIELALAFIAGGTVDIMAADPNAGVIEKTVDVLTTRWQPYARPTGFARFPRVVMWIGGLLQTSTGSLEVQRA